MIYDSLYAMSPERLTLLLDALGQLQRNEAWQLIQKEHVAARMALAESKVFFIPATDVVALTEAQTVWKEAMELQRLADLLHNEILLVQDKLALEHAKNGKGSL